MPPLSTEDPNYAPREPSQVEPEPKLKGRARWERKMGDSELAYFLPSREDGVNDM